MSEKTFIKGKDLDLESSITTMQAKLSSLGFDIEEVSWLNPLANCYSVHLRDTSCHLMFTNGKGACSKSSLASALGEYFERLSNNLFFADYYLGEEISNSQFVFYPNERWFDIQEDSFAPGLMNEKLWNYFNPLGELENSNLIDMNSGSGERGICALPFSRISESENDTAPVYIPVSIIANIFVSNGMSAGNTPYEARVQALSEILERYVKNKIIREGLCIPEIPQNVLDRFPASMETINELKKQGFHLRIADASLGGVFPVISVTLINPEDGSIFASFGSHPCFEVALERTVTELLQGRGLKELEGFEAPSFDRDEIASSQNIEAHFINSTGLVSYDFFKSSADFEFVDWNLDTDTASEYDSLVTTIIEEGFDLYLSEFNHLDMYACRILVPGMSDVYPVDDLVWNNNNEGAKYRESFLTLSEKNPDELAEILEMLEEDGHNDMQGAAEFIGVAPDADTLWSDLRLGEIKMMISLALKDEQAIEWVEWCLQLGSEKKETIRLYRCLHAVLQITWDETRELEQYQESLGLLFGKELLEQCKAMVAGTQTFVGLHCPRLILKGFETHGKLLEGYQKLQEAKRA